MQNRAIELFYLFFQGILTFQVIVFTILYLITRRKDILYYSLFLFFAAIYFFINAPYTFFGIEEDIVWNSAWYDYVNTPVIIIDNLFYILFLKSFFADLTTNSKVSRVLRFSLWIVPFMPMLFVLFTIMNLDKQFIFYTVNLIAVIPAIVVSYAIFKNKAHFASLVGIGLLCTIAGTLTTVVMIILRNYEVHHLFIDGYTLFFLRLGIFGDMIFFLAAILKKWHYQEKQLALEKLQSQLAVEQLRNKISGELHDDFGGTLSGINMYSYMIGDLLKSGNYAEADKSVSIIQKSADEMTHKLSDLIWMINPKRDSLQKLFERLEEFTINMASVKNIQVKIDKPSELSAIILPVEQRRNIYLICKEAINNAVKYSNATLLELTIKETGGKMEFSVNDNGKGFNAGMIKRGNGMVNMQLRAEEIGAKLLIQSQQVGGTQISLQCKIT